MAYFILNLIINFLLINISYFILIKGLIKTRDHGLK